MTATAVRVLQQENHRLSKMVEVETDRNQILTRYFELLQQLYWADLQIATEVNPLKTLNQLLEETVRVIGASDGSISRFDATREELVFLLVQGDLRHRLRGYRFNSNLGIAGWVVNNRQPIIVNTPRQDWRFSATVDTEFGFLTQSIASVPMISRNRLLGVIQILNKRGDEFTQTDVTLLLYLGQVAVVALEEVQRRFHLGQGTEAELLDDVDITSGAPAIFRDIDPTFAELLQN